VSSLLAAGFTQTVRVIAFVESFHILVGACRRKIQQNWYAFISL